MAWPEILINFFAVWFSADKFDVIKLIHVQASSEAPFGQNGLIDKQFCNTRIGYNVFFYFCGKQKLINDHHRHIQIKISSFLSNFVAETKPYFL